MAKKLKIDPVRGWVLICRAEFHDMETDKVSFGDKWHIAWVEPFSTKKCALAFAKDNHWPRNYRAVRGQLMVDPADHQ